MDGKTDSFNPNIEFLKVLQEHIDAAANLGATLNEAYKQGLKNGWDEAFKLINKEKRDETLDN